ncbi:hypothetical protein HN446_04740 [bacterium]|jgi:hypothetical protein|nr:hypothetical protein [bacterium]
MIKKILLATVSTLVICSALHSEETNLNPFDKIWTNLNAKVEHLDIKYELRGIKTSLDNMWKSCKKHPQLSLDFSAFVKAITQYLGKRDQATLSSLTNASKKYHSTLSGIGSINPINKSASKQFEQLRKNAKVNVENACSKELEDTHKKYNDILVQIKEQIERAIEQAREKYKQDLQDADNEKEKAVKFGNRLSAKHKYDKTVTDLKNNAQKIKHAALETLYKELAKDLDQYRQAQNQIDFVRELLLFLV